MTIILTKIIKLLLFFAFLSLFWHCNNNIENKVFVEQLRQQYQKKGYIGIILYDIEQDTLFKTCPLYLTEMQELGYIRSFREVHTIPMTNENGVFYVDSKKLDTIQYGVFVDDYSGDFPIRFNIHSYELVDISPDNDVVILPILTKVANGRVYGLFQQEIYDKINIMNKKKYFE